MLFISTEYVIVIMNEAGMALVKNRALLVLCKFYARVLVGRTDVHAGVNNFSAMIPPSVAFVFSLPSKFCKISPQRAATPACLRAPFQPLVCQGAQTEPTERLSVRGDLP